MWRRVDYYKYGMYEGCNVCMHCEEALTVVQHSSNRDKHRGEKHEEPQKIQITNNTRGASRRGKGEKAVRHTYTVRKVMGEDGKDSDSVKVVFPTTMAA